MLWLSTCMKYEDLQEILKSANSAGKWQHDITRHFEAPWTLESPVLAIELGNLDDKNSNIFHMCFIGFPLADVWCIHVRIPASDCFFGDMRQTAARGLHGLIESRDPSVLDVEIILGGQRPK